MCIIVCNIWHTCVCINILLYYEYIIYCYDYMNYMCNNGNQIKIIKFSLESIGTNSTWQSRYEKFTLCYIVYVVRQTSMTHPFVFDSNLISHSSSRLVSILGNSVREIMSKWWRCQYLQLDYRYLNGVTRWVIKLLQWPTGYLITTTYDLWHIMCWTLWIFNEMPCIHWHN